jgi:integrase
MARLARNALHLDPLANGRWKLHGYFRGKQIRKQSDDYAQLAREKEQLERRLDEAAELDASKPTLRATWLTEAQLRDAEAAIQRAGIRRLLDCVVASERVLAESAAKPCVDALAEWLLALAARRRFAVTVAKNENRVKGFLAFASPRNLHEITPLSLEQWVLRKGVADLTQVTDARVIHAWLRFCVQRRWLVSSPFELDLKDLVATARPKQEPRILSPEQCRSLLAAARARKGGVMVPYVVLALWCFLRHAEAMRTTPAQLRLDAKTPLVEVKPRKRGTVSYRTVSLPAFAVPLLRSATGEGGTWGNGKPIYFTRALWDAIRCDAGLIERGASRGSGKKREHTSSIWQENLLRHTGISYHYQRCGDIRETCRQAGNASDTAFRHYLQLPDEGAADLFYGVP